MPSLLRLTGMDRLAVMRAPLRDLMTAEVMLARVNARDGEVAFGCLQ